MNNVVKTLALMALFVLVFVPLFLLICARDLFRRNEI